MNLIGLRVLLPKRLRHRWRATWNRLLEKEQLMMEKRFYRRFIRQGDFVFDVGANDGVKTTAFLALGARVLSIEPNPACVQKIIENNASALHEKRLFVEPVAAGERQGVITLQLFGEDSRITSGASAFISAAQRNGLEATTSFEVEVETIDDLVARFGCPVFLKIDVEGMDVQVLRGCHVRPRFISFEFNTTKELWDEVHECLTEVSRLGFSKANFTGPGTPLLQLSEWAQLFTIPDRIKAWAGRRDTFGDIIVV